MPDTILKYSNLIIWGQVIWQLVFSLSGCVGFCWVHVDVAGSSSVSARSPHFCSTPGPQPGKTGSLNGTSVFASDFPKAFSFQIFVGP